MADETLLSAARRVSRFFKIDEAHGGMTSIDTIQAVETMDKEIHKESERQKADATSLRVVQSDVDNGNG